MKTLTPVITSRKFRREMERGNTPQKAHHYIPLHMHTHTQDRRVPLRGTRKFPVPTKSFYHLDQYKAEVNTFFRVPHYPLINHRPPFDTKTQKQTKQIFTQVHAYKHIGRRSKPSESGSRRSRMCGSSQTCTNMEKICASERMSSHLQKARCRLRSEHTANRSSTNQRSVPEIHHHPHPRHSCKYVYHIAHRWNGPQTECRIGLVHIYTSIQLLICYNTFTTEDSGVRTQIAFFARTLFPPNKLFIVHLSLTYRDLSTEKVTVEQRLVRHQSTPNNKGMQS
jgi:hypothetical protein